MQTLIQKLSTGALTLIAGVSLLAGCSGVNPAAQIRPGQPVGAQSVGAQADPNARYVITAQALIDKIATVTDPALQEKIKKDFLPHIKPLNRYALDNLIKYSVKVLQAHLQPGQDPRQHPVAVLIYPMLERTLDIYMPFSDRYMEMVLIATVDDPAQKERLFASFTAAVPKLAKADLRELLNVLAKNEGNFFPPGAPLTLRLTGIVQAALAR